VVLADSPLSPSGDYATIIAIRNLVMRTASKAIKTFSLDREILAEVRRTKGAGSESERVNTLLRFALDLERRASLHKEAAGFFRRAPDDRRERRGYQAANLRSWARD
jgi:hypothetical protein